MNLRRWLITLFLCLAAFAALAAFKFFQISAAIEAGKAYPEPSATVRASQSEPQEYRERFSVVGEAIPPHRLDVRNELSGKISRLNFAAGADIKAGQLLLQLDISEEQARLKAAKANAKLALLTLERNKKLRKANRVSAEAYDRAQAQHQTSLADIASLEVTIAKKTLTAPFAAKAGLHTLELGQYLDRNTLITTLIGLDDFMWVDFKVPQNKAELDDSSSIQISSEQDVKIPAQLLAQDSSISSSSRQLTYRARFTPGKQKLKANSMVTVFVETGTIRNVTSIPDVSLTRDQFGQYVYVLEPDGEAYRAQRRSVTVGPRIGTQVTILDGLKTGELIANAGAFKLRQGLKVFVDNKPPVQAPAKQEGGQ